MMRNRVGILMAYLFALVLCFIGCKTASLETVPNVDIDKYMGTWYEISSFPQRFQRGCYCTMAQYSFNAKKGYVEVLNSCRKYSATGIVDTANGKAFVTDKVTNAKLKVQFFWPFTGKYWVIALASDYSYAMVGHPNREYLWILNRMPQMEEGQYKKLVNIAAEKGFDTQLLQRTDQTCFTSGK
jgi:apolipoprotein D and lipocalin family protein